MPSPRDHFEIEYEFFDNRVSFAAYEYEDSKTGELFYYSRKGVYRKKGRTLVFKKRTRGEIVPDHILNKTSESYSDKKAGYPPNCNEGYVEKDGKCVKKEDNGDKKKNPFAKKT